MATAKPAQAARRALGSRVVGQAGIFTLSTALVMVLGGIGKAILANELSPSDFGTFAFSVSFLAFAGLFFEFGLFLPAARAIARHDDSAAERELVGASLLVFAPIAVAFDATVFGLSFVVDDVFSVDAGGALRVVAPLAFVYAYYQVGTQLAQGADRLHTYSLSDLGGQVVFVTALTALALAGADFTIHGALLLNTAGLFVAVVGMTLWLKPSFANAGRHARHLVAEARAWGFQVYIGRVLSVGSYNLAPLLVAAFADAESVGFYALGIALAGAVGLPVQGLGTTLFARMSKGEEIERRFLLAAWALGAAGVVALALIAPPLVDLVFGADYKEVATLALPLAMAQAVRGVTTLYNTFLSAHAHGRELRNAGLVLSISSLVLSFALIPPFGAIGAAWASLAALVANYLAHVVGYRRCLAQAGREAEA